MSSRKTRWILCKAMIAQLEKSEYILFKTNKRNDIIDALDKHVSNDIVADEDIKDVITRDLKNKKEDLAYASLSEDDAFAMLKKNWLEKNKEKQMHGLYFVTSIRDVAINSTSFLFDCADIEDVFGSDDEIKDTLVKAISSFSEEKMY